MAMWIRRQQYDDLLAHAFRREASEGHREAVERELRARIAATDVTCDWLRIRCTQLEKERAQMILQYTGVKIEVPVLALAPEQTTPEILNEAVLFEDVGDEIAKKLGITYNTDGTIAYTRKA